MSSIWSKDQLESALKLVNVEDTTLFEDIAVVREASQEILGYCVDWHSRHNHTQSRVSYACNGVSAEPFFRASSTDIGYQVLKISYDAVGYGREYVDAEQSLGLELDAEENEIFFDIENEDDMMINFDDRYDICLI